MDSLTENFYRNLGTLRLAALKDAFIADRAAAKAKDTFDFCNDRVQGIEKILAERLGPLVGSDASPKEPRDGE